MRYLLKLPNGRQTKRASFFLYPLGGGCNLLIRRRFLKQHSAVEDPLWLNVSHAIGSRRQNHLVTNADNMQTHAPLPVSSCELARPF